MQPLVKPVVKPGYTTGLTTGLTTGCIVYTNIYPVVKPVWQPVWQQVVSCKRGFRDICYCSCLLSLRRHSRHCYCIQRIRGFTTMRYINLRFTYLLTYYS